MTDKQAVTIYDIAYHAKVSQSTVSRVLSGHAGVNPDKRAAVLEAIERLGYKPNLVAQGLARGRSRAIGILVSSLVDPFFSGLLEGAESAFAGSGYRPLVASVAGTGDVGEALNLFSTSQVEALIIAGAQIRHERLAAIAATIPVITVGPTAPGLQAISLHSDNEQGGYLAGKHLLDLGHKHIAHITGPADHQHTILRLAGFRRALGEAGVAEDPVLVVHGNFSEADGLRAMLALLNAGQKPTAVFAGNDQIASGTLVALHHKKLRVPEDVSVIGFDDQRHAAYLVPPLTTIRQPLREMGIAAVEGALARLAKQPWPTPTFDTKLIQRDSTGPSPGA